MFRLTPEQRQSYEEKGFLILKKTISVSAQESAVKTLRKFIVGQVGFYGASDRVGAPPEDLEGFFNSWMEKVNTECHDAIRAVYESIFDTVALQSIFWNPELVSATCELLDLSKEDLYLNSNRLRIDPPGPCPYRLGWHQETSYTRSRSRSLQFWAPLLWPSSTENGSIEVAVGSHTHKNVGAPLSNPKPGIGAKQYIVPQELVDRHQTLLVHIEPGDLVIFSCDLFHQSSNPSKQKKMKYSLVGRFSDYASTQFSPFPPV